MTTGFIGAASVALLLAAAVPVGARDASPAAPEYRSSDPADGEEMHEAPEQVTISFSEPLDSSSKLVVTDECGRQIDDGNVEIQLTDMSVGIEQSPSGQYKASYEAVGVGGITGSSKGAIGFVVHFGPGCDGGSGHHHDGHDKHDGHGGKHDGHGGEHDGHDTTSHESHTAHASDTHSGHSMTGHSAHSAKHRRHGGGPVAGGSEKATTKPVAAPRIPLTPPDGSAIIAMLAISIAVGVMGGFVLRVSNPS